MKQAEHLTFMYGDEILEQVKTFIYLRVEILATGNIHSHEAPLVYKAKKAQFKMAQLCTSLSLETVLWLYQRMIDPILLHGSEVWSVIGVGAKVKQHGIYDTLRDGRKLETLGESIRRDFLRHKIDIAKHAPLLGIRGDTGVRPLYVPVDALSRALNYWETLQQKKPSSLLGLTEQPERELWKDGWLGGIQNLVKILGHGQTRNKRKTLLEDNYDFNWYRHLWADKEGARMLTTYRTFKHTVVMEAYMKGTHEHHKLYVARLRTGGHGLSPKYR